MSGETSETSWLLSKAGKAGEIVAISRRDFSRLHTERIKQIANVQRTLAAGGVPSEDDLRVILNPLHGIIAQ